jgi:hypothetical protein
MTAPFIIDQVSWHLKAQGNPETRAHIIARFWAVVDFLQRNGLTKQELASSAGEIADDFAIRSDDLTDRGLDLMRKVYDKWLTKVDEGQDPKDVTMFEKKLGR